MTITKIQKIRELLLQSAELCKNWCDIEKNFPPDGGEQRDQIYLRFEDCGQNFPLKDVLKFFAGRQEKIVVELQLANEKIQDLIHDR